MSNFVRGQRVRVHPASDAFMRGVRYGIIKSFSKRGGSATVRGDGTGRDVRVPTDLLIPINDVPWTAGLGER